MTTTVFKAVEFFREHSPLDQNKYIFNISSAGGYNAVPCLAFYSAGKFGECFLKPSPAITRDLTGKTSSRRLYGVFEQRAPSVLEYQGNDHRTRRVRDTMER